MTRRATATEKPATARSARGGRRRGARRRRGRAEAGGPQPTPPATTTAADHPGRHRLRSGSQAVGASSRLAVGQLRGAILGQPPGHSSTRLEQTAREHGAPLSVGQQRPDPFGRKPRVRRHRSEEEHARHVGGTLFLTTLGLVFMPDRLNRPGIERGKSSYRIPADDVATVDVKERTSRTPYTTGQRRRVCIQRRDGQCDLFLMNQPDEVAAEIWWHPRRACLI